MPLPARHHMEHRCGHRRATKMRVIVRTLQGRAADGLLANLSGSGALVYSVLPATVSSKILVQLPQWLVQPSPQCAIGAEVIRLVDGGFAIEWETFSPPQVRSILRQLGIENPPLGGMPLRANVRAEASR